MFDAVFFGDFVHLLGLGIGQRQRLFAEQMFAGPGGGNRDVMVQGSWNPDVDDVDILARNDFLPVGLDFFPTPAIGKFLQRGLVSTAGDL